MRSNITKLPSDRNIGNKTTPRTAEKRKVTTPIDLMEDNIGYVGASQMEPKTANYKNHFRNPVMSTSTDKMHTPDDTEMHQVPYHPNQSIQQ